MQNYHHHHHHHHHHHYTDPKPNISSHEPSPELDLHNPVPVLLPENPVPLPVADGKATDRLFFVEDFAGKSTIDRFGSAISHGILFWIHILRENPYMIYLDLPSFGRIPCELLPWRCGTCISAVCISAARCSS